MALAISLSWLWRRAAIVLALLIIRVFMAPHDRQNTTVSSQPTAHANAQVAPDRIK